MSAVVQEMLLREWGDEGTVELHAEFSKLIIKTASRTLLGACSTLRHGSVQAVLLPPSSSAVLHAMRM